MKKRDKQNLREDFIDLVKKDLNVDLELRDVVAIHRLPSDRPGEKPIIVRLFNSDAKRNVMRAKKNLKNNVRFVDDITKQNHELMYGKKVSIYLLCLILMSMSSYKPNLNCLSSGVLPYMPQL
jgi:hypothetical protein